MVEFILRRIFLVVPTLLVVMMAAFFLSKFVPGDGAEAMISMHGVPVNSEISNIEYNKYYHQLNLDKPTFYFSISPDFYPENINAVVDKTDREQIISLLRQAIPYHQASAYLQTRNEWLKSFGPKQINTTVNDTMSYLQSTLSFETDLSKLEKLLPLLTDNSENSLKQAINNMSSQRIRYYYPKFYWHGSNNQFHFWATSILKGNMGISIKDGRPISNKIFDALRWTLLLSFLNVIVSTLIAVPTGLWSGHKNGGKFDRVSGLFWLFLYAIPVFWLASVLIIYCTSDRYSTFLDIFPTPGNWYLAPGQSFLKSVLQYGYQLILPVICLAANDIAQMSRIIRNNVIIQKSKPYVLMSKALGKSDDQILFTQIFPNVLLPMITLIGGKFVGGMAGAVLIEVIFNIPGVGRLMYESIINADWLVVFGILLIISFVTILVMLLTDILYAISNPKIKMVRE